MTDNQLELANALKYNRALVRAQMDAFKTKIREVNKSSYKTDAEREAFDDFRQKMLEACDKYVEDRRGFIDAKFEKL